MATHYDDLIIGSGQAGKPLAQALAKAGRKVALVEREHVGGTCINEGCTPTKTMVASARVAYVVGRAAQFGIQASSTGVDLAKVRERKRQIVADFRSSNERQITGAGVALIMGEARFTGPKTVAVKLKAGGEETIESDRIFIHTGARPLVPNLPGLNNVSYLNSTTIMELDAVPEHLLVLGGGYIGLEFGQMFRRFGSQVTVVQRAEQLLGREDADVAEEVKKILEEDGIEIFLNTSAVRVAKTDQGVSLTVKGPDGERDLTGSHLLVAVGRVPNTDKLNLDAAGVETDKAGFVKVNDKLETTAAGIWALGDVKGGPAFTHISYDDYRIVQTNLIEGGQASIKDRWVPYTVFMDPQLGRIGLTEAEARAQGHKIKVGKIPMTWVARAIEMEETRGLMKAIVDAESGQILGASILGVEGGEIATMIHMAMLGKLPYTALANGVFPHPGLAESLNTLFTYLE